MPSLTRALLIGVVAVRGVRSRCRWTLRMGVGGMCRRFPLLAALVAGVVLTSPAAALAADFAVGHKVVRIAKPGESRTVDVHLWYPADAADWVGRPKTSYSSSIYGIPLPGGFSPLSWRFDAELAHEGAAVAAGGPAFPVIVFSHGSVNDPINSAHLLERIAADGFIVAAPTHVTDTQEDVRVEFINTRLGANPRRAASDRAAHLPARASPPVLAPEQHRPGPDGRTRIATSSTPWTHCPAGSGLPRRHDPRRGARALARHAHRPDRSGRRPGPGRPPRLGPPPASRA